MLLLKNKTLPPNIALQLSQYQGTVDSNTTFETKVAEGKRLFSLYNKKDNSTFRSVRKHLSEMSGGTVRCNYCEDSNANQVEHIYPKNYYPERCFSWINYCYACGPCNQPKNDHFSIFDSVGTEINIKNLTTMPPPNGQALLIDPRIENPIDLLFLDISDTFKFVPLKDDIKDHRRAEYTIELLGLNTRTHLIRARKNAFTSFKARLFEYVSKKESGTQMDDLLSLIEAQKSDHHQTVWQEMIRQRSLHTEINDLLNRAPEALDWVKYPPR